MIAPRTLLITSCLLASALGWTPTARTQSSSGVTAARSQVSLAFVPGAKTDSSHARIIHDDDPSPVIHTDTDEVERTLEEAYADYEEMLRREENESPFVDEGVKMRTPRNNHMSLTAMESSTKVDPKTCGSRLVQLDPKFEAELFETIYWNAWYHNLHLEEWRHGVKN